MFKKKPPADNNPITTSKSSFGALFTGGLALPKVQVDFGLHSSYGDGQGYEELAPPQAHYSPAEFAPPTPMAPQFEAEAHEPFTETVTPGWEHTASFPEIAPVEQALLPPSMEVSPSLPPSFHEADGTYPISESSHSIADNWDLNDDLSDPEEMANTWSDAFDDVHTPQGTYETIGFDTTVEPLWTNDTVPFPQAASNFEPEPIVIRPETSAESGPATEPSGNSLWDRPAMDWGGDSLQSTNEPLTIDSTAPSDLPEGFGTATTQSEAFGDFFNPINPEFGTDDEAFSDPFGTPANTQANVQAWNAPDFSANPSSYAPLGNELSEMPTTEWQQPLVAGPGFPSWASNPEEHVEADVSFDDFDTVSAASHFQSTLPEAAGTGFGQAWHEPSPEMPYQLAVDISEPFVQELTPGPVASPVYDNSDPFLQNWTPPEPTSSEYIHNSPLATPPAEVGDYWQQVAQSQESYAAWENPPAVGNQVNISQDSTAQFLDTVHETIYPSNAFDDAGEGFDEASALLFPETATAVPQSFSPQEASHTTDAAGNYQWDTPFTENAAPPVWSETSPQSQPVMPPQPAQDELSGYYEMNGPWHDPAMPVEAEVSFDDEPTAQPLTHTQPKPAAFPQTEAASNPVQPHTVSNSLLDEDDTEDDWPLNFDEPEAKLETIPAQQTPANETLFALDANTNDPFDFDSDWADDDLAFETEVGGEPNNLTFLTEELPQAENLPTFEPTPNVSQPDPFLAENEPLFDFYPETPSLKEVATSEESSIPLYKTVPTPAPSVQLAIPEHFSPEQSPATESIPSALPPEESDALNILHSLELTAFHRLLLVHHRQYFALMGQVGPEEEANITVLKLFPHNPLALAPEFLAAKEGQSANKDMFVVKLGYWQGIVAVGAEQIQLHSELTP